MTGPGRPTQAQARGTVVVPGNARGPVVVLAEPLSLWGGFDPETGQIIDHHHPQLGLGLCEAIVVMPTARGSSSASSVLVEAARAGTAPAGFVVRVRDEVLSIGAIVAGELYAKPIPVLEVDEEAYRLAAAATELAISAGGDLAVTD